MWSSTTCQFLKLKCRSDEIWVKDQHRRCSCLKPHEYESSQSVCEQRMAEAHCTQTLSYLYTDQEIFVGCGYFKTRG